MAALAAAAAAAAAAVAPPSRLDLMLLDHEFRDIYRGAGVRADLSVHGLALGYALERARVRRSPY